jgi:hypothetical protein
MIQTLYQLDFITASGTLRLLDSGARVTEEIAPKVSQGAATYAAIGAAWGESVASGGSMVTVDFSVVKNHASHAALRGYCMSHAASLPHGKTGTLRLTITGGQTWDIADATLLSCAPMPLLPTQDFETLTSYSVTGGEMLPAAAITLYAGIPWIFILQDWDALTGDWDAL